MLPRKSSGRRLCLGRKDYSRSCWTCLLVSAKSWPPWHHLHALQCEDRHTLEEHCTNRHFDDATSLAWEILTHCWGSDLMAYVCSAKMYPLEALMIDCHEYFKQTGRRITLEYTLMSGVNDTPEHVSSCWKLELIDQNPHPYSHCPSSGCNLPVVEWYNRVQCYEPISERISPSGLPGAEALWTLAEAFNQ